MNVKRWLLTLTILSVLTLISCDQEKFEARSDNRFLMGTVCIITLYNGESQELYDEAFALIEEEDRLMSLQKDMSDLARINSAAGSGPVEVSEDTVSVLKSAIAYAEMTEGAFDPTIAPLVELWGIGMDNSGFVPETEQIDTAKRLTDFSKVLIKNSNEVFLEDQGMKIDLGGIAKGYIADKVKDLLVSRGVKRGIINLGGNIVVLGSKPESKPWKIGIQDPFDSRGNHIGIAAVVDKTVVTSGIYERFFVSEGKRYHHILDPETGFPVENDLASVTIISDISIDADALSTSLFVLGVQEGMALIESIGGSEAVFVTRDKKVIMSTGAVSQFKLHHGDYEVISFDDYSATSRQ